MVLASAFFGIPVRTRLPDFALRHRIPASYHTRRFVRVGGLMSYGVNIETLYRRAADYVDRIARGAKPADLPIEQPSRFELVLNLKTAKALGVGFPQSILLRADEVIE